MRQHVAVVLTFGCRYILAAVLLMAAVTKLTDGGEFADHVVLHSGLPSRIAVAVVALLPWLELTCGTCLALGFAVREAALLSALLLSALLAYALTHLGQIDCRCFLFPMPSPQSTWWPAVRNGLLLMCALWTCRDLARASRPVA